MGVTAVVACVDVGQGDCTIAVDAETRAGLIIDCPSGGIAAALRLLAYHGATHIAVAVLTHGDIDHAGGLVTVLDAMPPAELRFNHDTIVSADPSEMPKLKAVLRGFVGLEHRHGSRLDGARAGDVGRMGSILWSVLSPSHGLITQAQVAGARNRASVVLRLDVDDRRFLIAGDADGHAWKGLLANATRDINADVLLVPHHGAQLEKVAGRPGIEEVLAAVDAAHHVVSVGTTNGYGHPADSTLRAVRNRGGRLTCTEINVLCSGQGPLPLREAATLPEVSKLGRPATQEACRCAGTITFTLDDDGWVDRPLAAEHDVVISALPAPRCRI